MAAVYVKSRWEGESGILATISVVLASAEKAQSEDRRLEHKFGATLVSLLTLAAVVVHGYHPYAEDGGLYLAGVKKLLRPDLYPHWPEFVTEHLRFSLFAPMVAGLVRETHVNLMTVMLTLHVVSFWATLFAAWQLAARCYESREARCGAVALLAVWLTIPVAGTSLMLMDPYVSARSLSTPCGLLALVGMLDFMTMRRDPGPQRWYGLALCGGAFVIAALMHPLMAAYTLGCLLLLAFLLIDDRTVRLAGTMGLCATAILTAMVLCWMAPPESAAYVKVAMTRSYWFVAKWAWYEQFGLIAPLAILGVVGLKRKEGAEAAGNALARVGMAAGAMAGFVAIAFGRAEAATHLVARLQPLRLFQMVYVLMILVVGATVGGRFLRHNAVRWVATFLLLGGVMLYVERQTFPDSAHLELPWTAPQNGWEQAFVWISRNSPVDARFAVDAHYIEKPGEDAQTFRAIAERSVLPDYSKDGGEAAITPELTRDWTMGQKVQTGLDTMTDVERVAELKPLGVNWVVLQRQAVTGFACDYEGTAVKVCRLP